MKILVFAHRTVFSGGANRSLLSVVIGLKRLGHEIEVVLPNPKGELNDALSKENIKWRYCKYFRMGAKKHKGIGKIISYTVLYTKLLQQIIASKILCLQTRKEKYDLVYVNTILPYVGLYFAKAKKIPCVIHDRESLDANRVLKIKNYERFLYNNSDKIIVISSDLKEQWKRRGMTDKIELINNGIELFEVQKANQTITDNFKLLLTARITPVKRHYDALKAILELKKRGIENIRLYFAGKQGEKSDAEYYEGLKRFIEENNLQENVEFLGEQNDMAAIREKMHVELMCNPDEPYGRVTVEGMRSGLVVIGVNAGGTLDIVEDGLNGILYEKDNINDLANKIEEVYKNNDMRFELADRAYEYSNCHYTIEETVKKIENTMEETIASNR